MIPQQTLVNYPVFGDDAEKVQPEAAKYSSGFLPGEVLPAQYHNWFLNKGSAGVTRLNEGVTSIEAELINVVEAGGGIPDEDQDNQVISAINTLIAQAKAEAILAAHPVGSLYWTNSTENPSLTFGGGTWEQIKDKFILAAGDTYTKGTIGGAATVTLTSEQMPSHTHTFTGSAVTSGANNRGHTHSVTAKGSISGGAYKFTGSAVTSGGMSANSTGRMYTTGSSKTSYWTNGCFSQVNTDHAQSFFRIEGGDHTGVVDLQINVAHTHSVTAAGSISVTTNPTFTGSSATSGDVSQNHTHSVTADGTNANTGGNQAHDNMPPYLVQYCWRRTA